MKTIIVWYRNDLRIHDHPALSRAVQEADKVIPLYIFDKKLYEGKRSGSNRNRFLLESLQDLRHSLQKKGGELFIRSGTPLSELEKIIKATGAEAVYCTADYSPYAVRRDKHIEEKIKQLDVQLTSFGGRLIVSTPHAVKTKSGSIHKVFTPYWKVWSTVERGEIASLPRNIHVPSIPPGRLWLST